MGSFPYNDAGCWTCCKEIPHSHGYELEKEEFEGVNEFDELD